jgi:hypothetical protein
MEKLREGGRFITDEHGERVAVIVDLEFYRSLLEAAEELEEIRDFDTAKESGENPLPFEQALRELRERRR